MKEILRVSLIAGGTITCAILNGLISLFVFIKFLPPSDGAYGQSLWKTLSDPFVFIVWIQFVLYSAVIGFAFAVFMLWKVELVKSFSVVIITTIILSAIVSPVFAPLAAPISLVAGVCAMAWCRNKAEWKLN